MYNEQQFLTVLGLDARYARAREVSVVPQMLYELLRSCVHVVRP